MKLESNEAEYKSSSRFSWLKDDFHHIIFRIRRFKRADLKKPRYILSIITLLLAITGLALFIQSIAVLVRWQTFGIYLASSTFLVPRFALATSILVLLIAILGFHGVKSQKYKFILAYAVLLVPILVFEVALTVTAFNIYNDRLGIRAYVTRYNPYLIYPSTHRLHEIAAWDSLQRELQCCGSHIESMPKRPMSCCNIPNGAMSPFECTWLYSYKFSCDILVMSIVGTDLCAIGLMSAAITCLQGIFLGLAAWIAFRLKYKPLNEKSEQNPVVTDFSTC